MSATQNNYSACSDHGQSRAKTHQGNNPTTTPYLEALTSHSVSCQVHSNNNVTTTNKHSTQICDKQVASCTGDVSKMGGVLSAVTSTLCGVTRTAESDEAYIRTNGQPKSTPSQNGLSNRLNGYYHSVPAEEVVNPATDNSLPKLNQPTLSEQCETTPPWLAAQTSLDLQYADESSSQESTPRFESKLHEAVANHKDTNGYHKSLNNSDHHGTTQNKQPVSSHQHVGTINKDNVPDAGHQSTPNLLNNGINTEDDPDEVDEVIELSEPEFSADEEQVEEDGMETEEEVDCDGDAIERVQCSDDEGPESDEDNVHICDSDCSHSDEEIEDESEESEVDEESEDPHECDSECDHTEYEDEAESEAEEDLESDEVDEETTENQDGVIIITDNEQSEDEHQLSDQNDDELDGDECVCTSECPSDCDGDHHECSSECGCEMEQCDSDDNSESHDQSDAESDNDLDGSDYEAIELNVDNVEIQIAPPSSTENSSDIHRQSSPSSDDLSSTNTTIPLTKASRPERNNNRLQRNHSQRQLVRSNTDMIGELKTAIDARVRRSVSCRETAIDYRKKYQSRNDPDIQEHLSKLDVKERETRRKDRRSRLRTLELKREQFLDELRGGKEDNVIERVYRDDLTNHDSGNNLQD